MRKISDWFSNVRLAAWNLWRWAPVLWGDQDWDHSFLLRLLEFKFRNMSRCLAEHGHLQGSARHARQLAVCAELCKRIRSDEYLENLSGEIRSDFWDEEAEGGYELHVLAFKDGKEVSNEEYARWAKAACRNQKNDVAYLGKLIGKFCLEWWD